MKKKKWRKSALAFSAFLFVLWWALGTGATLAWFSDTDTVRNNFQIGRLNLDVSYKNDIVTTYTSLEGTTKAFNDKALYEPGYTQVVYLKIDNKGDVDFQYKVAVTVEDFENGQNAWGNPIYLPDYLRYGVVFAETEAELVEKLRDRLNARNEAMDEWGDLGTWSEVSPYTLEAPKDIKENKDAVNSHYAALVVYMPESVDNRANYRGGKVPTVELGISVFAQQANAPMPTE